MPNNITKVKNEVKKKVQIPEKGWPTVLADLQAEESRIRELISIVERKIAKGEPWPTQSENRNSEPCHSV